MNILLFNENDLIPNPSKEGAYHIWVDKYSRSKQADTIFILIRKNLKLMFASTLYDNTIKPAYKFGALTIPEIKILDRFFSDYFSLDCPYTLSRAFEEFSFVEHIPQKLLEAIIKNVVKKQTVLSTEGRELFLKALDGDTSAFSHKDMVCAVEKINDYYYKLETDLYKKLCEDIHKNYPRNASAKEISRYGDLVTKKITDMGIDIFDVLRSK